MDQSIINFKVYEDSVEYVGMAQATLPDLTALTQSISGAGIAGNVESVILGPRRALQRLRRVRRPLLGDLH